MTQYDIALRLGAAALVGFLVGLERSRRVRFVGARTFGIITLAGAVAGVLSAKLGGGNHLLTGGVLTGILTGVGFVGAGVIMHPACRRSIHGVTTAAGIWVSALIGFGFGVGEWSLAATSAGLLVVLLIAPEPRQLLSRDRNPDNDADSC